MTKLPNPLKTLTDLINIPSDNPPATHESKVAIYIENFFQNLNIPTKRIYFSKDPERFNLIVTLRGLKNDNPLTFTGHMDVVPISPDEKKRWNTDPFTATIENSKIYGRGSTDMKGGLTAIMHAIAETSLQYKPQQDLIALFTGDEENLMLGSKALVKHLNPQNDAPLIVAEPTNLKLATASRGRTFATITLHGKTAHGSQKNLGLNAITVANELLSTMQTEDFSDTDDNNTGQTFWQPLAIHAQVDPGIIPDTCKLSIDARLSLTDTPQKLWNRLEKHTTHLKNKYPHKLDFEIQILDKRPPWITSYSHPLIKTFEPLISTKYITFMGSTDANILQSLGYHPVIIGPGKLEFAHKENECLELDELYTATELYKNVINLWHQYNLTKA